MIVTKKLIKSSAYYRFGTQALNVKVSHKDPITNEAVDKYLDRYGHLFRSFVLKRRLLRSQIWPKIHIIDNVPQSQKAHLKYQSLYSMKKSMKDQIMKVIAKNDPSKINSSFIISIFSEDYFKEMMDQYVGKVLICGKAPANQEDTKKIQQKVLQLYLIYYFGERSVFLERQLQNFYLSAKQFKYFRFLGQKSHNKNEYQECKWTEKDQRVLQQKQNWNIADPNLTDINYRTYFYPLQITSRLKTRLQFQRLYKSWSYLDNLKFDLFIKPCYNPQRSKYYQWIHEKIFIRIINHIKSLQFTSTLNIPHDYMIEAQMIQIHFWLVIDRLKKCNTLGAGILARMLTQSLNFEILKNAKSVNVKKSNVLVASLQRMLQMNSIILDLHFNKSQVTRSKPYKGIDAMIWSIAFAEKVHRYSQQIYLFSEYLIKNFEHMQQHSQEDLMNGIVQFDAFLINNRYRQIIEKVNPPLSAQEFQKQFNSNSDKKDYYYSKIQTQIQQKMTIDQKYTSSKVDVSFSFSELLQPIRNLMMKYTTLRTMDHYNSMQQKKKENQQAQKKGTWRSQKDDLNKINSQFISISAVKNVRRRKNDKQVKQ